MRRRASVTALAFLRGSHGSRKAEPCLAARNFDEASAHQADAGSTWPELTDERDSYAIVQTNQLLFESSAELFSLRAQGEDAIRSGAAP